MGVDPQAGGSAGLYVISGVFSLLQKVGLLRPVPQAVTLRRPSVIPGGSKVNDRTFSQGVDLQQGNRGRPQSAAQRCGIYVFSTYCP